MKKLTIADDVTFSFSLESEDLSVRGNCMASGDDAFDKQCEDEILKRLDKGDVAAWFCAKVTASWKSYTGVAYLGACSYESVKEAETDLFDDMKQDALDDLNASLLSTVLEVEELL